MPSIEASFHEQTTLYHVPDVHAVVDEVTCTFTSLCSIIKLILFADDFLMSI